MTPKTTKIVIGALVATAIVGYFTKDKWMPIFKSSAKPASTSNTLTDVAKPMGKPVMNTNSKAPIPAEVIEKEKSSFVASRTGLRDYKASSFSGSANLDNQAR
jgi:hypothetical protein